MTPRHPGANIATILGGARHYPNAAGEPACGQSQAGGGRYRRTGPARPWLHLRPEDLSGWTVCQKCADISPQPSETTEARP